ncbi:bifunctional folylpolyglutamate synthase/dihydrofolate synthase [candidate division KSB1 bacterium]
MIFKSMTYREANRRLNERMMFGMKLGLGNMRRLLKKLDNPERRFRTIHIAGTNGKGSTAAMLASMLTGNGFRTGLYTSPHISTVRERMNIDGRMIGRDDFARLFARLETYFSAIPATYFECVTALAFFWFSERSVDTAVIEVGMGGRYDATNVIEPVCTVITSIGFDHMEYLGATLADITREKCGIIKKGVPVVTGVVDPQHRSIIRRTAEKRAAPFFGSDSLTGISQIRSTQTENSFHVSLNDRLNYSFNLPLAGSFQIDNARTAITVMQVLSMTGYEIELEKLSAGMEKVEWTERFMLYRRTPDMIIDVAHNTPGFEMLCSEIRNLYPGKRVILLVGMKEEKDCEKVCRAIIPVCDSVIGIPLPGVKSVSQKRFSAIFQEAGLPFTYFSSIHKGVRNAHDRAGRNDLIVYAGSHYAVDRVKKVVNSLDW